MQRSIFIFASLIVWATANPIKDEEPKPNYTEIYRLPKTVSPSHYHLALIINDDIFDTNKYDGMVKIELQVSTATDNIRLHSHNSTKLTQVIIQQDKDLVEGVKHSFNDTTEILTINATKKFETGNYTLNIYFQGTLQTDDMYGFYKSSYAEDGKTKYLGTTQFEATYARRAFPCFDEPSFKAPYDVSIQHPTKYVALFNTDIAVKEMVAGSSDQVMDRFLTTPPMSSYLIAFIVSEFTDTISETKIDGGYPHRVWSKKSSENARVFASQIGPKLHNQLAKFTGISLADQNLTKVDEIAIPDFSAGAMENWALVTYREAYVLNDQHSTNLDKQSTATVISHEFTHQWFGDYVTLNWWSETWLNEGFATYFEYHAAAMLDELKSYELEKQFVIDMVQTALAYDTSVSIPPMSDKDENINTPEQIANKFDAISYNKGGSVLRMLRTIVGDSYFQTALRNYLSKFHFSNTTGTVLWDVFDQNKPKDLPIPDKTSIKEIIETWTTKSGYPVVYVTLKDGSVNIYQERYLTNETTKDSSKWYVPISYTTNVDKDFSNTKPKVWLTPKDANVTFTVDKNSDWLIVNIQESGFYRVNYDIDTWKKIASTLSTKYSDIDVLNRAQIVDDAFNLARSSYMNYEQAFEIFGYLKNETEYYPWASALSGYSFLLQRTRKSELGDAIAQSLVSMMDTIYKSVNESKESDQIYSLKQQLIWKWACKLNNTYCVAKAQEHFNALKLNKTEVPVNLRSAVYCSALRHSTDSSDWDYLWQRYVSTVSSSEQKTILPTLGCTTNSSLLNEFLMKSITPNSGIRKQDAYSVFAAVINGNVEGVNVAFEFLTKNLKGITDYYRSMNSLNKLFGSVGAVLSTDEEIKKFETFITEEKSLTPEAVAAAKQALQTMNSNKEWTNKYSKQLMKLFGVEDGSASSITFSVLLLVIPILLLLY